MKALGKTLFTIPRQSSEKPFLTNHLQPANRTFMSLNFFTIHGFRNLLFFLLLYIFGSPFLVPYPSLAILAHGSLTVTLFFSIYAIHKKEHRRSKATMVLVPVIIVYWLGIYELIPFTREISFFLLATFYFLLTLVFSDQLLRAHRVTPTVIHTTLCIYLIIGLFWGALYSLLEAIVPGSYAGPLLEKTPEGTHHVYNYFSMVTLTTLGYGDITPQTPGASALCQMEAIVGQFFIAVVVAWMVGNYAQTRKREE